MCVLALLSLLLGRPWARKLAAVLLAAVLLLAVPIVGTALLSSLDVAAPSDPPMPGAIVILSADGVRVPGAEDLEPGLLTLDRLRAGAALARRTGLPVLVSGGSINAQTSLAQMMVRSLRDDFGVVARWQEDQSRDTWENASKSAPILKAAGITRVYVVTQFWHMRRALIAFRAAGLDPVPFPVRPFYHPTFGLEDLLPQASTWYLSYLACHEWVGTIYYRTLRPLVR